MLRRIVVPARLALIYRSGNTLAYNPAFNVWHRPDDVCAETLRWLRAGRAATLLRAHLARRFGCGQDLAEEKLQRALRWAILRRLLYLDREPELPRFVSPANPLATVYWICTQGCNLRCTYCYQEATVARPHELSTAEAKQLVDQVVEAGANTFVFTGGEPFTRRDLLDLARYSRSVGLRTNVITNGHYVRPDNAAEIAASFDTVTISLDHGLPEHHDRHRGEGAWQRAIAAIDLLLQAGVRVDVNSVLSRSGLADVRELLRLGSGRPIGQHKIVPRFPMGRGATARDDELTPVELLHLDDQLQGLKLQLGQEAPVAMRTEGGNSAKGSIRGHCGAGLSEVSIDPEGWVYPCKLLQYPDFRTENIRDSSLANIFKTNSSLVSIQQREVDTLPTCKTCIIKNHCGGGCRGIQYSFSPQYDAAHPLFCAFLRRSFEISAWSSTGDLPADRKSHFHQATPIQGKLIPLSSLE
jgi:radical SAM protein with 4Fe4S-binding SPASM domain